MSVYYALSPGGGGFRYDSDRCFEGFPLIKPEVPKKAKKALWTSLAHGMSEDLFYETFVQCFVCKDVMLRLGMFSSHRCSGASDEEHRRPRVRVRAHLGRIQGDVAARRRSRTLRARSSSLTPTEIASEPEAGSSGSYQQNQQNYEDHDLHHSGDESDDIPSLDDDFDPPSILELLRR